MLNEIDLSRADLNLLVLFETVFEERHVGRAAERLNLSASAVSHGLGRLRRMLNDPLFLKMPKGVVATSRATELAEPIADVLARVRRVVATAVPFDSATSRRRFVIGMPDGFSVFLPRLLVDLAREAQGIDLAIRHIQRETALADVDARLVDVAVAPFSEVPARFAERIVYEEDFVVAMRRGHVFAKEPTLDRYCEMRHLLVAPRGDLRGGVDERLEALGRSRRVAVAVPNFMLAVDLVSKTDLISVLPRYFVEMHAGRFDIITVPLPLQDFWPPVKAVVPKAALMDAGIVWLLERIVGAGSLSRSSAR
jgi:DNA-binding transcriptional LysR family regulator